MKNIFLYTLLVLVITHPCSAQDRPQQPPHLYAIAQLPTPVLNTSDFPFVFGSKDGKTLPLDDSGLIREVEFVALPKTVFEIEDAIPGTAATIYRITTADYPYPARDGYFIDSRFVKTVNYQPEDRLQKLPPQKVILDNLLSAEGSRYIWGGNYRAGIPEMLTFYPPCTPLSQNVMDQWILKGLDCSGLLYEATNGCTPRNTSSLITFGKAVPIATLNSEQIIQKLKTLDILVWKGHVIIVIDRDRTIESRLDYDTGLKGNQGGVRIRTLKEVLDETLKERIPVNQYADMVAKEKKKFVVRRWYKQAENE
ncbi:MAG: peptidoglycan endopeptidase [Thermodesulfobacteriota bacterium]|nr:peptidoglycan endopeptidase [Thermodesulfobacteriota bacterium]